MRTVSANKSSVRTITMTALLSADRFLWRVHPIYSYEIGCGSLQCVSFYSFEGTRNQRCYDVSQ